MAVLNSNRFDLREAVNQILREQKYYAVEALTQATDEVSKEAVQKLKSTSPKRTGEYARNWARTINKGRLSTGATVYGKSPTYRMAHLLEKPHLKRNGERSKPIVHIEPVHTWAQEEVIDRIIQKLEREFR